jgi:hypothetical protein
MYMAVLVGALPATKWEIFDLSSDIVFFTAFFYKGALGDMIRYLKCLANGIANRTIKSLRVQ